MSMANRKVIRGNYAAAYGSMLARARLISSYPITPHTEVIEKIADLRARGELEGVFVNVESEHSVMMLLYGAAMAGLRVFTSTSSQGLMYMHEALHWVAGARLPIVMTNIHRAPGTPWNLDTDQRDSLSQRDTGWMQFYCESAQEVVDNIIQAYKIAEQVRLPAMVCMDAFYLSHTYEVVDLPDQEKVDNFLGEYNPKINFSPEYPGNYNGGLLQNLWRFGRRKQQSAEEALDLAVKVGEEFSQVFGRWYGPVETVQDRDAETIIVTSDTISRTVRSVLPIFKKYGERVGLLKIRMFRPFPAEQVRNALGNPTVKNVIVFDRNISIGSGGIFCQEIKGALYGAAHHPRVFNVIVSDGVDVTPKLIGKIIDRVNNDTAGSGAMIWGAEL